MSDYSFDLISKTGDNLSSAGNLTSIGNTPSINDSGWIAFVGKFGQLPILSTYLLVGKASGELVNLSSSDNRRFNDQVQINNNGKVIVVDGGGPKAVRQWDANSPNTYSVVATANYPSSGYDFEWLWLYPSVNNNDQSVFVVDPKGSNGYALATRIETSSFRRTYNEVSVPSISIKPVIADNGTIVATTNANITLRDYQLNPIADIASPNLGFSFVGIAPNISSDGKAIAFYGDLTNPDASAATQGLDAGAGIFVSLETNSGRKIERIAGIAGNGILDPGETHEDSNGDGVVDPGEDKGLSSSFYASDKLGISYGETGDSGSGTVAYLAYDENDNESLITSEFEILNSDIEVSSNLVVKEGEPASEIAANLTGNVRDLNIYDPINESGQLAFWVETDSSQQAVVRANPIVEECSDTGLLNIEGEFEDLDNDGDCDAEGTVNVGRSDAGATRKLISIVVDKEPAKQSKAEHDDKELRIANSIVYAAINNNITLPLFHGSFALPFEEPVRAAVNDTGSIEDDFTLGGLEVNFNNLRLKENQIHLQGDFSLPLALGGLAIDLNTPNALFISEEDIKFGGGSISFPVEEFKLFNSLSVIAQDASLEYLPVEDEISVRGKFALNTPLFKNNSSDNSGASIGLDISGKGNYLRVKNGVADLSGAFLVDSIIVAENFGIEEFRLGLTTEDGDLINAVGKLKIIFPWVRKASGSGDGIGLEATAGFVFPDSGPEVDTIGIGLNDLNQAIGSTGFFLQYIDGTIRNFAPSNQDRIEFDGSLGLTYGPEITVDLGQKFLPIDGEFSGAALSLDVDKALITAEGMGVELSTDIIHPDVFTLKGKGDIRWEENKEYFSIYGGYNVFKGVLEGDSNIQFDFVKKELAALGNVTISFPETSVFENLKGKQSLGARSYLKFTDDQDYSNDYIAAWGVLSIDPPDPLDVVEPIETFGGFRFFFNNEIEILTELPADISDDIESTESGSSFTNSSQFTINEQSLVNNKLPLTLDSNEIFQTQMLPSAENLSQFEETFEVEEETDVILIGVHWDNPVNPDDVSVQLLTDVTQS